jgi:hypothetical protein
MGKKKRKADYSYYKHHPIFDTGYADVGNQERNRGNYGYDEMDPIRAAEMKSRMANERHTRDTMYRLYLFNRASSIMENQAINLIGDKESILLLPNQFSDHYSFVPLYDGVLNQFEDMQGYYRASERALGFLQYLSSSETIMENNRKVVEAMLSPYVIGQSTETPYGREAEPFGSFDWLFAIQYLNSNIVRKCFPDYYEDGAHKQEAAKLNERFTLSDPIEIDFADFYTFAIRSGKISDGRPYNQFNGFNNVPSLINYWDTISGFYFLNPLDMFVYKIVIEYQEFFIKRKNVKIPLIDNYIIPPNEKIFLVTEREIPSSTTEDSNKDETPKIDVRVDTDEDI